MSAKLQDTKIDSMFMKLPDETGKGGKSYLVFVISFFRLTRSCCLDVLAATSVLQQKANEIRSLQINWQSYLQ